MAMLNNRRVDLCQGSQAIGSQMQFGGFQGAIGSLFEIIALAPWRGVPYRTGDPFLNWIMLDTLIFWEYQTWIELKN